MSAPTPAPGDESPREGYYPDPSIPGYVRYWNGASWVPGTSRPAPQQGEPMPASPAGRQHRPQQPDSPVPSASSVPSDPSVPAAAAAETPMEETGPVFLDEEPQAGNRPEPATAWQADASRQAGFGGEPDRRVSWGAQSQPGAAPLPTGQGEPDGQADSGPPSGPMSLPGSGTSASAASGASGAGPGPVAGQEPRMPTAPVPVGRTPADDPSAERLPDDRVPASRAPVDPVPVDPVSADPRQPASRAPADGALPGMRGGDDQTPENTVTLRAVDRGNRPSASRTPGQPAENGTMAIRPPSPGPGAPGPAHRPPSTGPGPVPAQGPVSVPAAPANPNPNPIRSPAVPGPASATAPAADPAVPANPGPGGAGTPWAQAHGSAQSAPAAPQQPQAQQPQPQQLQAQQPQHPQQPQSPLQPPSHLQQPRLPHQAQQSHPHPQLGAAGGQQPDQPVTPWKPPVDDPFQQLARAQASARPAGLGKRFVARLVDTVVLGALVGAIGFPLVSRALDHIDAKIDAARTSGRTVTVWLVDPTTAGLFGAVLGAFLVLGVLLEALPTAKWGRTLGKKLCGLEVRDIESHGSPSFGAALRRWLVYGVLGLLVIGVANVLWCLFDRPWRQCWHDKAAHTFVAG
ncbi:RDD family protein [Streptomyces sp. NPDC000927]|uniref:RDD family protein n=1 Tax=Streptomyces sp. NPDC000927 TaxID=3154371 RepID=UPI00331B62D3